MADTLSIETSTGSRFSAVVLDRTVAALRLGLDDGTSFSLGMLVDESLPSPGVASEVFSKQIWLAQ